MSQTHDSPRPRLSGWIASATLNVALGLTLAACLALPAPAARADEPPVDLKSPVGLWTPLDFSTGKPMGLIRIYESDGQFFGRIEPVPGE